MPSVAVLLPVDDELCACDVVVAGDRVEVMKLDVVVGAGVVATMGTKPAVSVEEVVDEGKLEVVVVAVLLVDVVEVVVVAVVS
jgi:hypothetical protein